MFTPRAGQSRQLKSCHWRTSSRALFEHLEPRTLLSAIVPSQFPNLHATIKLADIPILMPFPGPINLQPILSPIPAPPSNLPIITPFPDPILPIYNPPILSGTTFKQVTGIPGNPYTSFRPWLTGSTLASASYSLARYSIAIDWGDGTTPTAGIAMPGATIFNLPPTWYIMGEHAYQNAGTYDVTITLTNPSDPTAVSTVHATASVAQNSPDGITLTGSFGESLAITSPFTDYGYRPTTYYSAIIDWGDGYTTPATITATGTNAYAASGSHTYAQVGSYRIITTIYWTAQPTDGVKNTIYSTALITPSMLLTPITSPPVFTKVINQNYLRLDASVVYTALPPVVSTSNSGNVLNNMDIVQYTATINWGDGTTPTPAATIATWRGVQIPAGALPRDWQPTLIIHALHAYAHAGTYSITITLAVWDGTPDPKTQIPSILTLHTAATVSNPPAP